MSRSHAERVLDDATFAVGAITLTPGDVTALELPPHSTSIPLVHQDETIHVEWRSRARTLAGEALLETMELHGQIDGLLRLHRDEDVDGAITIRFLDRPTSGVRYRGLIAPAPSTTAPVARKRAVAKKLTGARKAKPSTDSSADRKRIRDRKEFTWHGPVGIADRIDSLETSA